MPKVNRPNTSALRALPSVDQVMRAHDSAQLGLDRTTAFARRVIEQMRDEMLSGGDNGEAEHPSREALLEEAVRRLTQACEHDSLTGLRRVINATGVILHTNLGRAPLSAAARSALTQEAAGYCNLEYDTLTGSRGRRGARVEELLKQLTGAQDALVVNNGAAAALLVLTAIAHQGETLVSRGELVEIGGDFRVPDVLANSGTRMIEVGTTNRTSIEDYRSAITEQTRLILRIHPSNFRIVGFTAAPTLKELAAIAHTAGLWLYEDAGSGVLEDLSDYGLSGEPIIRHSIADGVDVVSFSGDKLLGSAQAGLIVGRSEVIQQLRRHSLYRALRVDKLCLAALEATLEAHLRGTATEEVPALRMLAIGSQEIEARAAQLIEKLSVNPIPGLTATLIDGESAVGGGSGPNTHPPTFLIALTHDSLSADQLDTRLRQFVPPVISRIAEGKTLLDLRTVEINDEAALFQALHSLAT